MSIYHVAKNGLDKNSGSETAPFLTIQHAADIAVAGDRIIVHEGTYREWVDPKHGGIHNGCRIIYEAAKGERVIIKGSEVVTGWKRIEGTVWKAELPETMFHGYNPYRNIVEGDWYIGPLEMRIHLGEVYLNGKAFYEAASLEEVFAPRRRDTCSLWTWGDRAEKIWDADWTIYQWYCETDDETTTIYANFHERNPNEELTEINVRRSCFYPSRNHINYITVRGFEMCHAATPWAPPTADQPALLGPNWSKGWIIENNRIHDSKCNGISLGKEASTGDNNFTKWHRKPGYQYQMESVFQAKQIGWSKDLIGSHIVRNNRIYDCGQTGIVGHMGCVFSEISGNEIFNVGIKHEFTGHEVGGVKLHAAIDVVLRRNYIHHCTLGTWLDWQAQGVRVTGNIYDCNNRDFMIEVTHGPYLVDNNIFTSDFALVNAAQGGAYVHNLIGGFVDHYPVLNRSTPYHFPHSTELLGTVPVYGLDDRFYQNIFIGGPTPNRYYGTKSYNGAPVSMDEYIERVKAQGDGDLEMYEKVKQPAYINGNVYLNGAERFDREVCAYADEKNPDLHIVQKDNDVYLEVTLPDGIWNVDTRLIDSDTLGMPRIVETGYENPDGSPLIINADLNGAVREKFIVPGPLQQLKQGFNRVKIWEL